uniref:RNase H type-1 domain-containing protein n=1 Tax=Cannabis sativa TaxID=3483 RepID=A0A803QB21_CANSA
MMVSPEGLRLQTTMRLKNPTSNNKTEYEALLIGLRLSKVVGAHMIEILSDSQFVVNQVLEEYKTCGERMTSYVTAARELLHEFKSYKIEQIPKEKNAHADCLEKLALDKEVERLWVVPIEYLLNTSILAKVEVAVTNKEPNWMDPIMNYLTKENCPKIGLPLIKFNTKLLGTSRLMAFYIKEVLRMPYLSYVFNPRAK